MFANSQHNSTTKDDTIHLWKKIRIYRCTAQFYMCPGAFY